MSFAPSMVDWIVVMNRASSWQLESWSVTHTITLHGQIVRSSCASIGHDRVSFHCAEWRKSVMIVYTVVVFMIMLIVRSCLAIRVVKLITISWYMIVYVGVASWGMIRVPIVCHDRLHGK